MKKFFSLSRQAKCIPIIATQSISSLKSSLPGEDLARALFARPSAQRFFWPFRDDLFREDCQAKLCGKEDQPQDWL